MFYTLITLSELSEYFLFSLKSFPSVPSLQTEGHFPLHQRGSCFTPVFRPPGVPGAWTPGNQGACSLEVVIMCLHSSGSSRQVARVEDDKETIPAFMSPLLSPPAPHNETAQQERSRKGIPTANCPLSQEKCSQKMPPPPPETQRVS